MLRFHIFFLILLSSVTFCAGKYTYNFKNTPLSQALSELVKQHPEVKITFIYNELENYTTSASIDTDNLKTAVTKIIGMNPVTVTEKKNHILIEALQKGKYCFKGALTNEYKEPIAHATILLLNPRDSVVITYALTKTDGQFIIPCDKLPVIAKISSTGYKTLTTNFKTPDIGKIRMNTLAVELDNITVIADEARMLSDRTIFVPLQRQKNAATSGIELLERMNIPQVRVNPVTGVLETNTGKAVSVFVDYIESEASDMTAMNLQDVKRVEYYEFSSDPRFMGKKYVVNFIMTKYLYGGYTRLYGYEYTLANKNNIQINSRFQYKKMTYDIVGSAYHSDNSHDATKQVETYRLPQNDGTIKTFQRFSNVSSSKNRILNYNAAVKARYNSDNMTIQNQFAGSINDTPVQNQDGSVTYQPEDFHNSIYNSFSKSRNKSLRYLGSFFFSLPHNNTMNLTPRYSFSHVKQSSIYNEQGFSPVENGASDNTHFLYAHLNFVRQFNKEKTFILFGSTRLDSYRTHYYGSSDSYDRSKDFQVLAGASFNYTNKKINSEIILGWTWNRIRFNDMKTLQNNPLVQLSLQYLFTNNHQINANFDYERWAPMASYKSDNIIKANHLMSYTGNPNLKPSKTLSADISYNWIPSNKGYLSVYGNLWAVNNRFVYNYEANAQGILRTICQPLGHYLIGTYGVSGRLSFMDGNLRLTGRLAQYYNHNGAPYNYNRFNLSYGMNVAYYLNDFYFNASFSSPSGYSDGYMNGIWVEEKSTYYLQAGWANKNWNIRVSLNNFARWNWENGKEWFSSKYYDKSSWRYSTASHADLRLTCTYTISYGKKVRSNDEPKAGGDTSSGILKQ